MRKLDKILNNDKNKYLKIWFAVLIKKITIQQSVVFYNKIEN